MKNIKYLVFTAVFLLLSYQSFSQRTKIRKATKDYDNFAYIRTTDVLLEVANKGYKSLDLFRKLGDAYYFNSDMVNAAKWYKELMAMNKIVDPEYYWRYAQALKGIEDYKGSDKWMKRFNKSRPDDTRGKVFSVKENYLESIEATSNDDIELINLPINSDHSDFGSIEYDGMFIFSSSRGDGKIYSWNGQPFLNLYSAQKDEKGVFNTPTKFGEAVSTKFHESSPAFTPDGKYMFFTRNNFYNGKDKKDNQNTNHLNIYRASLDYDIGEWSNVEPVEINNKTYSVAFPAINSSGTKLVFSSDMPGGMGHSDLYVVDILSDGTLGSPVNLGGTINAEGSENFPYINTQGDLYFSSNSYPGLGGLDIYVVRGFENTLNSSNRNFVVQNLAKPVNSAQDDFAYYENLVTQEVYFSSNRPGGKGDDDIYYYKIPEPCLITIRGITRDKDTKELLPNTTVTLFDNEGNSIGDVTTDAKATFVINNLECDTEYLVRGQKQDYIGDEERIITPKETGGISVELLLENNNKEFQPCDDLAKLLDIPVILFDYDKSDIRYDAELELQKVLAVMSKYPTLTIDIRSHTDCRGSASYNEQLSDKRAQSTRQYLIDKGVSSERITAKGYGENQLLNNCACEPKNTSTCSEEEHQKNRRSEFIVTSYNGYKCANKN